jgi:tRNA threonylcarbamoyladenosine biosynthesis protein TsaB
MRILALETSGTQGSVATLAGTTLLEELPLDSNLRSAQSLAPAIKRVLRLSRWKPGDVELVAAVAGPGSFTGLRIGVMTAKAFAYAVGAKLVGLNTLEVVASAMPRAIDQVEVVWDAQRKQLFRQRFERGAEGRFRAATAVEIVDVHAWLAALPTGLNVAGPPLESLGGQIPGQVQIVDKSLWWPTASAVGHLAARVDLSQLSDIWTLAPDYHRRSAAEEKAGS